MEFKKVHKFKTLQRVREMITFYNPSADIYGNYYVALGEGRMLGCVCLTKLSWYLTEVRHLYVKPEFRRQGAGRFLIENAIGKVKTPLVCATVKASEWSPEIKEMPDSEISLKIFKIQGFTVDRRFKNSSTGHELNLLMRYRKAKADE